MATHDQRKSLINAVQNDLALILGIELENELIRENILGTNLNFSAIREVFSNMFDVCSRVRSINFEKVPFVTLKEFSKHLNSIKNFLKQIKDFDPSIEGSPGQRRDQLLNLFRDHYDIFLEAAMPLLMTDLLFKDFLGEETKKINELLKEVNQGKNEINDESSKIMNELSEILSKAKAASAEIGVSKHSKIFLDESGQHEIHAKKWLNFTYLTQIIIVVLAIALLNFGPDLSNSSSISVIHLSVTKIIVLTVLFYTLSICRKNYKAHKHNSVLNKHRHNALTTFETFVKSTSDAQTKNAILIEVTHSIFSNQQSGYLPSDNESESPNKIIEVFKGVSDK